MTANEESTILTFKNAKLLMDTFIPEQFIDSDIFNTTDGNCWQAYFYPQGTISPEGQARTTAGLYISLVDGNGGIFGLTMSINGYVRSSETNPDQFYKDRTIGFYNLVPCDELRFCITPDDSFVVNVTMSKK